MCVTRRKCEEDDAVATRVASRPERRHHLGRLEWEGRSDDISSGTQGPPICVGSHHDDDETIHRSIAQLEFERAELGLAIMEARHELERADAAGQIADAVPRAHVALVSTDGNLGSEGKARQPRAKGADQTDRRRIANRVAFRVQLDTSSKPNGRGVATELVGTLPGRSRSLVGEHRRRRNAELAPNLAQGQADIEPGVSQVVAQLLNVALHEPSGALEAAFS